MNEEYKHLLSEAEEGFCAALKGVAEAHAGTLDDSPAWLRFQTLLRELGHRADA